MEVEFQGGVEEETLQDVVAEEGKAKKILNASNVINLGTIRVSVQIGKTMPIMQNWIVKKRHYSWPRLNKAMR
jgi:hypothetical protein